MKQQVLLTPPVKAEQTPLNKELSNVLVHLWDEAEQSVVTQRRARQPVRQTNSVEKRERVRYAYD